MAIWSDPIRLQWSDEEAEFLAEDPESAWMLEPLQPSAHFRPDGEGDSDVILMLWEYHTPPVEVEFRLECLYAQFLQSLLGYEGGTEPIADWERTIPTRHRGRVFQAIKESMKQLKGGFAAMVIMEDDVRVTVVAVPPNSVTEPPLLLSSMSTLSPV